MIILDGKALWLRAGNKLTKSTHIFSAWAAWSCRRNTTQRYRLMLGLHCVILSQFFISNLAKLMVVVCVSVTDFHLIAFLLHISVSGAVFARIVPDRRQFFEYDNVSVLCEEDNGISEWSVKWKSHKITNSSLPLNISASPCTIYPIFKRHSGEYWCENEKGERSEVVNISVTAGFVILESPTIPVMEGNDVTLNCTNKQTQSEHITDFYKDGVSLGTWYQSSMTIKNISKSDEGLYKCSISGAGESPESWLAVIKQSKGDLNHIYIYHIYPCFVCFNLSFSFALISSMQPFQCLTKRLIFHTVMSLKKTFCCGPLSVLYWRLCCCCWWAYFFIRGTKV
uniref:Ig-like domain-containing protein n=1 Tax=Haplochromis burtoni TaxID=8153 RepID=A0A3Q2XDG7_HAPBU